MSPLLLVPASLPPLALAFAPSNVLHVSPALKRFTAWMIRHVPHVSVHAESTQLPEVALLVDCLVLAVVPLLALVVLLQSLYNYRHLLARHLATGPHPMRNYFLPLVGVPLFLACLMAMVALPGDPSWAKGYTTSRTIFYGFLVFTMPLLTGYVLGVQVLSLRLFVDAYLFPTGSRRKR